MRQSPAADPFAHCSSQPALTPGTPHFRPVSRTEATVPRLQPEEFASPLQSGLRYGIMSHISGQPGFSPGSSQQVCYMMCVTVNGLSSVRILYILCSQLPSAFVPACWASYQGSRWSVFRTPSSPADLPANNKLQGLRIDVNSDRSQGSESRS